MMREMKKRIENDSLGEIEVPGDAYFGAQTARSLIHFNIGLDKMPGALIRAFGILKKAAADVNLELGLLDPKKAEFIIKAAEEVIEGKLMAHFPLSVWQTGSGTQTNMNVNEVIANRATELMGGKLGSKAIHPNDDVNMSQSSNDTFPTAMHIAAAYEIHHTLFPAVKKLKDELAHKTKEFAKVIKMGRTHLMDALPMTLGQEFSGYHELIEKDLVRIEKTLPDLYELAIGATAIGTGFLAPKDFGEKMAKKIAGITNLPFVSAKNKFAAISAHDPLVFASAALKTLACSMIKIATDLSWMGSGPRCGLSELHFPENEPGSSIMPGKINPTQCEAVIMVSTQVIGNDTAISIAGAKGNFELNVFKPLIIHNFHHSLILLADALTTFTKYFLVGIKPNVDRLNSYVQNSLMLVTALRPKLGYDMSAKVAMKAYNENLSLKEACLKLGYLSEEEFDKLVDVNQMY